MTTSIGVVEEQHGQVRPPPQRHGGRGHAFAAGDGAVEPGNRIGPGPKVREQLVEHRGRGRVDHQVRAVRVLAVLDRPGVEGQAGVDVNAKQVGVDKGRRDSPEASSPPSTSPSDHAGRAHPPACEGH